MDAVLKQTQHEFRLRFYEVYEKYKTKQSLEGLDADELRILIAGECWMDGADWNVAMELKTSDLYSDTRIARNYLVDAFDYKD